MIFLFVLLQQFIGQGVAQVSDAVELTCDSSVPSVLRFSAHTQTARGGGMSHRVILEQTVAPNSPFIRVGSWRATKDATGFHVAAGPVVFTLPKNDDGLFSAPPPAAIAGTYPIFDLTTGRPRLRLPAPHPDTRFVCVAVNP